MATEGEWRWAPLAPLGTVPGRLGASWESRPAGAWGRLRQGPSLGPLLPLGLLRVGWAYIFLLGPSSLCSQGVDSALAQGPRFRMRVGRDTPSLAKGLPLPLSCVP